jgi:nicotinamidase-related amidase
MTENIYGEFLDRSDCVLLLVDVQKAILDLCVEPARLRKHCAALIEIASIFQIPMVFSQHNPEKLGGFLPELVAMSPEPIVMDKLEFSCLENEAMARRLESLGRQTLLLCGMETHVCIFHTGAHAARLGYRVHVAGDAVSSRSTYNWETGLRRLEHAGAVVSSTEMIIYELLNRAGTPEFRQALPLLKRL